jgi:DNA-binding FadR family transcriptional regulator
MRLVEVQQGSRKRPVITRPTSAFVSDFLRKALLVGDISGKSITQLRLALEPSIAEIVSMGSNSELLVKLDDNIHQGWEKYKNKGNILPINTEFHVLIARSTKNPLFAVIINTLLNTPVVVGLIEPIKDKLDRSTLEHHEKILDAIRIGNFEQARKSMQEHILEIDGLWDKNVIDGEKAVENIQLSF